MQIVLLVAALVFIAWDLFMGFRRGFYPALIRLGFVAVCFLAAYLLAAPLSGLLMIIPLPFLGWQTLHGAYEGYIAGQAGLSGALSLAEAIEQLVLHFPDVLLAELNFLALFMILRLLTLPLSRLVTHRIFGKPERKKSKKQTVASETATEADAQGFDVTSETSDGVIAAEASKKTVRVGSLRSCGMVIGLLQAVVCFAVLLVPIFGVVEFGERFHASFENSEQTALADISADIKGGIVDPINESFVAKTCDAVGIRSACVKVFHGLSRTKLVLSDGTRKIDYFDYLESMFPAVSALLKLADVNPEDMTNDDYENLATVLKTAQDHEDLVPAVRKSVAAVVEEFVEESYRSSANVVVSNFSEKIVKTENALDAGQLKHEVSAIKKTMKVIQNATDEGANGAFAEVGAGELVDDIIETQALYETLIEVSEDPEQRATLSRDFASSPEEKVQMKADIDKYRAESMSTRDPVEIHRILAITDALALIMDLQLDPIS